MPNPTVDSARPPPAPDEISKIGPYLTLTKLRVGPVATAYLCRRGQDTGSAGLYVVSVVHAELGSHVWLVERLMAEVAVAARIAHPNVEVITEFGTTDHRSFVATRYVEGTSLVQMAARQLEMPPRVALPIVVDVLRGLHAAHSLRDQRGVSTPVVHSGVGPASIFIGFDGIARVTEFGIARVQSRTTQTLPGLRSDRFAHLSPEQVGQPGEIDARADIFGVGTVLWSLLTGRPLFRAVDAVATMHQVLHLAVPAPSTAADVPAWLDEICLRALHKIPQLRYATADLMASALEERAIKTKCWANRAEVAEWSQRALASEPKPSLHPVPGGVPKVFGMSSEPLKGSSSSLGGLGKTGDDDLNASSSRTRARRVALVSLLGLLLVGGAILLFRRRATSGEGTLDPKAVIAAGAPSSVMVVAPDPKTPPLPPSPEPTQAEMAVPVGAREVPSPSPVEKNAPKTPVGPRPKGPRPPMAPVPVNSPPRAAVAPSEPPPSAKPTPAPLPSLESNPYLHRAP